MIPRGSRVVAFAACLAVTASVAGAAPIEYVLELPAEQMLAYEVEFEVAHPGRFTMDADWSPTRVLVFRLERPGEPALRRSGPPPQSLELDVEADDLGRDATWTLVISGLPARQASQGRLVIDLPDPPELRQQQTATDAAPPVREPDPWTLPVDAPAHASHELHRLFDATERFRQLVVDAVEPDAYRWHDGMLRYLADRRDRNATPQRSTRTMLLRVAEAVERLDRLRLSENRPLVAQEPSDPVRKRAWLAVRDPRYAPIEQELGSLLDELHRGHAPELQDEVWFSSFLSCLIVCERHFEERARLGKERASNRELVQDQWASVLAAAQALETLTGLR